MRTTSAASLAAVLLTLALTRTAGAASAPANPDVQTARSCVADETAPITFYGSVPASGLIASAPSVVQIFPESTVTTFYLSLIEQNARGRGGELPPEAASDPQFVQHQVDLIGQVSTLMRVAKFAPLLHTGQFVCRGFTPGSYAFLATVHAIGHSANSSLPSLETYFYRADVTVPATRKGHLVVTVPAFHLLGQNPQ
jgi:hypothetical protein